ncbi:MAG: flagellar motility protein MotE (MotC chaperone) [Myxococcota bacterium]
MKRIIIVNLVIVGLLTSAAVAFAVGPKDEHGGRQQGLRLSPNKHVDHRPVVKAPQGRSGECALSPEEEYMATELREQLRKLAEREALTVTKEAALRTLHERIARDLAALAVMQLSVTEELEHLRVTEERLQRRVDSQNLTGAAEDLPKPVADVAKTPADAARKQRIEQLAQILKKMSPDDAGPILEQQDDALAVAVLDALGSRQAGKILSKISPQRAVALARGLVEMPVDMEPVTP